ncbi:MAG: metalloregulator ArsR/SmtB family transcription factor [Anaerolineales bacterium]|jgi:DNA-binding transcriptional ArsR family regulator|nr:metalloregulator ArsR/SmtB family transcription factor [Anaerolineales bacterium]
MASNPNSARQITWDFGTAYEFFISLQVLHNPEYYGVRASWAAGVRSRIPATERKLLEEIMPFVAPPLDWIYGLPQPKDALSALYSLRQIPAEKRLEQVFMAEEHPEDEYFSLLQKISRKSSWDQADLQAIRKMMGKKEKVKYNDESISRFLEWWVRPAELGEGYLSALQAYQQAFFEEEERRVTPVLKNGLEHAQELAAKLSTPQLLTELSQGVQFAENILEKDLILIPAYWITPLVMYRNLGEQKTLILFGARPANMADIPGELVPDDLLRKLKALADPTRLKILRYLSNEELMPSELARRLHLRAPTVTHHLNELRLAGLVNLRLQGQEKRYTARREALQNSFDLLRNFLTAASDET